jgi:hypothetical protein
MKFVAALALLLTFLLPLRGEDQVWNLTDGRVVQVSKVLSQTPTHVTVRCSEGLLQIDKRQLPPELQEKYPYDSAAAEEAQRQQQAEQARREAAAAQERAMAERRMPQAAGRQQPQSSMPLRIVNVRPAGPGVAYVTIVNNSSNTYEINRSSFVGVTVVGTPCPSASLTNPRGDVLTRVKIGPNETTEVGVFFRVPTDAPRDIGSVGFRQ